MKLLLNLAALSLTLLIWTPPAGAAPAKARTLSGIGILLINKEFPEISLFKEASIGRIADTDASMLPRSQSINPPEGFTSAVVTSKKGGWFRIVYDDGEREGWIKGHYSYKFSRWEELFKDRQVTLLGGLRKEYYQLRSFPDSSLKPMEVLDKGAEVNAMGIEGEWLKALTDSGSEGWLRWQDENGRLVISINL